MIIIPAIDIIGGRAVRLYQGDYNKEEVVAKDIVETALSFESLGAEFVHLVDLDGAKKGVPTNHEIILKLAKELKVPVEVGGGIRSLETIEKLINGGVSRTILGTSALNDEKLLKEALRIYGDKIAVGLDCKNGYVCGNGWLEESTIDYIEMGKRLEDMGVYNIILTDIAKDGTLQGPNYEMLSKLSSAISVKITASGGIRDIEHIKKLKEMDLYGAITGKAIYAGTLDLKEAINCSKM